MKTLKLVLAWVIVLVVVLFAAFVATSILKMTHEQFSWRSIKHKILRERFDSPQEEVNGVRYVTLHHTQWCHACKNMMPVWQEVKTRLAGRPIRMIENDEDKSPTEGVNAYPTIYLLDEYGKRYQYHGGPEVAQLMQFILAPGRGAINV